MSEQRSKPPTRWRRRLGAGVLLVGVLVIALMAAVLRPAQRLLAATLGQPSVVRVEITLGDPTPPALTLRPGQILGLYLRSPSRVGGFWLPSAVTREEVLTPGVDYPQPLPSSSGFRERYDAYTADQPGQTSLRMQYAATDPATVPASAPKDKYGVPGTTLAVEVAGTALQRPADTGMSCAGRSWSADGFRVSVTSVVAHHQAFTPCLTSDAPGSQPSCSPYLETMVTLAIQNGSVYDWSTVPADFWASPVGSGPTVKLGSCSYVQGQPDLPRGGAFLVPPGGAVSHYVFCLPEPPGGLGPRLRWRPAGTRVRGELAL